MVRINVEKNYFPFTPPPFYAVPQSKSIAEPLTEDFSTTSPFTFPTFQARDLQKASAFTKELAIQQNLLKKVVAEKTLEILLEPNLTEKIESAQKEAELSRSSGKSERFLTKVKELAEAIHLRLKNPPDELSQLLLDYSINFAYKPIQKGYALLNQAFQYISTVGTYHEIAALKKEIPELEKQIQELEADPTRSDEKERLEKVLLKKRHTLFDRSVSVIYDLEGYLQDLHSTVSSAFQTGIEKGIFVREQTVSMIQTTFTALGLYTGVIGLGFTLYKLKLNNDTLGKINHEVNLNENRLKEEAEELSKELLKMRLGQLQEQSESTHVNVATNTISVATACLGITLSALTLAGMTCPPVAATALGLSIVSTVGYGGYMLYKKRFLIQQYAYQASSFALSTASMTGKLYQDLNRKIATLFHQLTLAKSLKESERITSKIAHEFEVKEQELRARLDKLIEEDVDLSPEEMNQLITHIKSIEKELENLQTYKESLLKGYEGLKNRAIETNRESLSEMARQAESIAQKRLEEQEQYNSHLQEYKDAASAALFRISLEKYREIKNSLVEALSPPNDPSKLFYLLGEEPPKPPAAPTPEMVFAALLKTV